MLSLLRELEWAGSLAEQFKSDVCCPECYEPKNKGRHTPDCRLAALLEATK